jgi:maltose alpha-D-glucosyltransferase / alpha-amylase
VLAIRYDWRNNSVVVVHNLSAEPREVLLDVGVEDSGCLVNLLSQEISDADAGGKHRCC